MNAIAEATWRGHQPDTVLRCACGWPLLVIRGDGVIEVKRQGCIIEITGGAQDVQRATCSRCGRVYERKGGA